MKRLMSGTLLLGAVLGAASCSNVTGDLAGGPTSITVDHNPLLITKHTIGNIVVQNLDDQGSPLLSAATFTAPTGPITIEVDTAFQHAGTHYGTRFIAGGTDFGVGFVTFSDAGLTAPKDTVIVIPNDTNPVGTLSTTTPTVGQVMTMTISGQFRFDSNAIFIDSTAIATIPTGLPGLHDPKFTVLHPISVSADSQTITFEAPDTIVVTPGGNLIAHYKYPVTVNGMHYQFSPAYPWGFLGSFSVQSSDTLFLSPGP